MMCIVYSSGVVVCENILYFERLWYPKKIMSLDLKKLEFTGTSAFTLVKGEHIVN